MCSPVSVCLLRCSCLRLHRTFLALCLCVRALSACSPAILQALHHPVCVPCTSCSCWHLSHLLCAHGCVVLCASGGGRKIIRVEVSLDGGSVWRQAEIIRHEKPTPAGERNLRVLFRALRVVVPPAAGSVQRSRLLIGHPALHKSSILPTALVVLPAAYFKPGLTLLIPNTLHNCAAAGKYWCWVFWEFAVQTVEFARASEVLVRAWDSSMNTQPNHMTWNVMGMMNNCNFRIKLHQHVDEQVRLLSMSLAPQTRAQFELSIFFSRCSRVCRNAITAMIGCDGFANMLSGLQRERGRCYCCARTASQHLRPQQP